MLCLLCRRPSKGQLCGRHSKFYIFDKENNWFRKRKRLDKGARRYENRRRFHHTESKLLEILNLIYGYSDVIAAVHPIWAVSNRGALLEYDIGIISRNLLIEYNGLQHYEYPNYFYKTREKFKEQVGRDKLKSRLAKVNGWKLVIFKYNESITYGAVNRRLKSEGAL